MSVLSIGPHKSSTGHIQALHTRPFILSPSTGVVAGDSPDGVILIIVAQRRAITKSITIQMATQVSSITQALAGRAAAFNISSERSTANQGDDMGSAKGSHGINGGLPTPPNSISPNLPPQWRARISKEGVEHSPTISVGDSDLDLGDAFAISLGQAALGLPGAHEEHAKYTANYLAKFLADILQEKGPLSVHHAMVHLGQVVPGFMDVPPAKARRLTTAALDCRLKGDVGFEKIGSGKWATRARAHTPLSQTSPRLDPIQEGGQRGTTSSSTAAISIPGSHARRPQPRRISQGGSWTASSSRAKYGERADQDMPDHDAADLMSIDGDVNKLRLQERRESTALPSPLDYSDTDEEDWSNVGAAALRHGSLSSTGGRSFKSSMMMAQDRSRRPSFTPYGRSVPGPRSLSKSIPNTRPSPAPRPTAAPVQQPLDFTGVDVDEKEQAAIAALLRMGSYQSKQ